MLGMLEMFSKFEPVDQALVPLVRRRRVYRPPPPCASLERAWAAIPMDPMGPFLSSALLEDPQDDLLSTSPASIVEFQHAEEMAAMRGRYRQEREMVTPCDGGGRLNIIGIAGRIYLKGVHRSGIEHAVAEMVRKVTKDREFSCSGLAMAVRTVAMTAFNEFWVSVRTLPL